MMAKPMETLELPYPMIQFLIILNKPFQNNHPVSNTGAQFLLYTRKARIHKQ